MDPNASNDMHSDYTAASPNTLNALQLVAILPNRYSQGIACTTSLKKIGALQIEDFVVRDRTLYYVIGVYLQKPESHIPTNANSGQQQQPNFPRFNDTRNRTPDFQIERSFSEFVRLRSKMYREAQQSHNLLRCDFCNDIVSLTLLSDEQPKRFMNLLFTRTAIAPILTQYLSDLMNITIRSKRNNGCRECTGRKQIPQLLLAFLQPEGAPGI